MYFEIVVEVINVWLKMINSFILKQQPEKEISMFSGVPFNTDYLFTTAVRGYLTNCKVTVSENLAHRMYNNGNFSTQTEHARNSKNKVANARLVG